MSKNKTTFSRGARAGCLAVHARTRGKLNMPAGFMGVRPDDLLLSDFKNKKRIVQNLLGSKSERIGPQLKNLFNYTMAASALALVSACGGGGGSGGGGEALAPSSLTIQGVAATGAAISGGTVDVKCRNGAGTAVTNADGTYSVTVVEGAQPCILRAIDPISKVQLFSIVESGGTIANITPITSLVVANTLSESPEISFSSFSAVVYDKITEASISTAVTRVKAATASIGTDADMSDVNIMKGSFRAATDLAGGDDIDKKIDALMATLTAADKKITDLTEQFKTATTSNSAISALNVVVGDSKYSLDNCPYARTGDVWALDFRGVVPALFNVDFNRMMVVDLRNNSTSNINFKRDGSSNVIPCAFTATIDGQETEYRISEGGVGVWKQPKSFGLVVPAQKTKLLTDVAFAGTYPSVAFIREKNLGFRAAVPIRFEINSSGGIKGYSCDMTKTKPDCSSLVDTSSADDTFCTPQANGTFACTSTAGLAATGILYTTGNQATMFMTISNMSVGDYRFGGLMIMTKAAQISLPNVGKTIAADAAWYSGVTSNGTVISGGTSASKVESVDVTNKSYTTSSAGSTTIFTRYIDTPTNGLLFSNSTDNQAVTLLSPTGWSVAMVKSSGTEFNSWYAYVRAKR